MKYVLRTLLISLTALMLSPPAFSCSCHNAQDFVIYTYSLIFAADHHRHKSTPQPLQHLDKSLRAQYDAAIKNTPKGEVGCIDSNIFTGAQDIFNGFFVEAIKGQANAFRVYLFFDDPSSLPPSSVVVKIAKQGTGWKITDILYEKDSLSKRLAACKNSKPSLSVPSPDDDTVIPSPGAPKFEDYPAVKMDRPSAPLQLKGKQRRYRTVLKEAYAKGPNFAGYLSVVVIGFGTGSRWSYIMDHRTGRVIQNPPGVAVSDEGMFESCREPAHQLNSNLLVISPIYQYMYRQFVEERAIAPIIRPIWAEYQTMYMIWDGKRFKKVFQINIEKAMLDMADKAP